MQVARPFRGLHYNFTWRRDLSALIAPPFDLIDAALQADLYGRDEHNFVRLELGRTDEADSYEDNRYTRAAADLHGWLEEGVLAREERPALYLVEAEFAAGGRTWRRRGVFAAVRLPEEGEHYVLPHEDTFASPKEDRFRLMQATQAMISPVLAMHEDARRELLRLLSSVTTPPDAEGVGPDGVTYRLWVLADESLVNAVCAEIGSGPLYIADGHHRFETARLHRDAMRARYPDAPPDASFNYALMHVLSAQDEALKVLPVHRLVSGLELEGVAWLKERMVELFEIHPRSLPAAWEELEAELLTESVLPHRHVFLAYCADGTFVMLVARDELLPPAATPVDRLDVTVLHRALFDPIIAWDPHVLPLAPGDQRGTPAITYSAAVREAAERVARGECECGFLLRAPRVSQVMEVAQAGQRMPHKSTYFYPKAPAGLVISCASPDAL
jgi:uncharacterized protein (DUF1015 family)